MHRTYRKSCAVQKEKSEAKKRRDSKKKNPNEDEPVEEEDPMPSEYIKQRIISFLLLEVNVSCPFPPSLPPPTY